MSFHDSAIFIFMMQVQCTLIQISYALNLYLACRAQIVANHPDLMQDKIRVQYCIKRTTFTRNPLFKRAADILTNLLLFLGN